MTDDELLKTFETAWHAGDPPRLADFVPLDPTQKSTVLAELVHLDLEFRLKRGESIRVERYLEAYPELSTNPDEILDLLNAEFILRKRHESHLSINEYLVRFPSLGDQFLKQCEQAETLGSWMGVESPDPTGYELATVAKWPNVPGCQLLRELGRGGMGVVYLARQPALNRLVAVKVMGPHLRTDEEDRQRFSTEIQSAARLRHPHIVQLYEVGEVAGQPYCILEYVEGGCLAEKLTGIPLTARDSAALVEPLARAMQYAHGQGIVHRDLKPANILLNPIDVPAPGSATGSNGTFPFVFSPKIADFGLAKRLEEDSGNTRTGVILGTASYMAPEQASGRSSDIGPATDVYALGAVLYELLTGRPPFRGATVLSTLEQVKFQEPVAPSRLQPRTPRDLETICLKCLEKDSERRYRTAAELADDLQRFQDCRPILARPTPWWETARKWCRRQPLAASVLGILFLTIVLGVAGVSWQWWRAELRTIEAENERIAKELQRQEVIRRLYFHQIGRAQQAWLSGRPLESERLLQECQSATPHLCSWEWRYLKRLCQPAQLTLSGHDREIRGLAVTPDGRRVISASGPWMASQSSGQVIVWDARTGQCLRRLPAIATSVYELALHPDGRRFAAAGGDGGVRVWDLEHLDNPPRILDHGDGNTVLSLAFAGTGDRLASACQDGTIRVWDLATWQQIGQLPVHGDNVFCVAYSPDGKWLASAGRDGVVTLRDAVTLKESHRISYPVSIMSVSFSPDSRQIAVGTFAGQIEIRNLNRESAAIKTFVPDAGFVRSVAFSPDGQSLAWCTNAEAPRLIDIASGKTIMEFRGHDHGAIRVAFSADARQVFTGGADGIIRRWDLSAPREPNEFIAHAGFLYQFAMSPDGSYLALPGGYNQSVLVSADQNTLVRMRLDGSEPTLLFKGQHK